ncbi:MAG: DNA-directed RNA polymerase [Nanoarchaeota archaeon]|nr:DNA-directed RNA polymerase [Nanoarchaeota archaeon]
MYQIVTIEDVVRVPPAKFGLDLNEALKASIAEKMEGKLDAQTGIVLSVIGIDEAGEGKIIPGDGAVHYTAKFKVMSWMPREQEIVEGEVVDITEFGAFIRIGAIDGLVHISQVMDDYVSYDEKNSQLAGRESRRILKQGDGVRARIISISFKEQNKIGLTMRQPYLGALHWEEKPIEKRERAERKPKKKKQKIRYERGA